MIIQIKSLLKKNRLQIGSLGYEFYLHSKRMAHELWLELVAKS